MAAVEDNPWGPEWEGFEEEGYLDEIICGRIRRNKDGTITVMATIFVYSPDGEKSWIGDRRFRLRRDR